MTILRVAFGACGLVFGLSAFVHPAGQVRVSGYPPPILQGSGASPAVLATMERSCQNCHSEQTKWPWYSYVAPMSWLIENDVSEARRHMNLTRWNVYTPAEKTEILSEISPLLRNHIMPPRRYVVLHGEAQLTAAEVDQLIRWTREERRRIKQAGAKPSIVP